MSDTTTIRKKAKKGVLINLDEDNKMLLILLAEKDTSSMSQVIRRLISDEARRRDISLK